MPSTMPKALTCTSSAKSYFQIHTERVVTTGIEDLRMKLFKYLSQNYPEILKLCVDLGFAVAFI